MVRGRLVVVIGGLVVVVVVVVVGLNSFRLPLFGLALVSMASGFQVASTK